MKGFSATTIVIASILLMGTVTTSQFVFADGGINTPPICEGGPTTPDGGNVVMDPTTTINAASNIVSICIKNGEDSFPQPFPQHSGLIVVDGDYGFGCYTVLGLGTTQVTVTENANCMDVSHVDFFIDDMVGGHGGITDNTALLVSGSHLTASWMIPLLVSAIGIGVFVFTRK